ncbi:MAG: GMP synthase (glutamine-hydrolysing) [Candidatus Peregrinibacteria bacterium Greene1014_49]|nr:MAG: GMP synthase (glutamine-hydrolysing) [Candidatus Peregrinibacteria bacterium Greene1014_49]
MLKGSIIILDFGGQYAHLIGSRIRRFGYPSYIYPCDIDPKKLKGVAGIILSGGPQSVYEKGSPKADTGIFDLGVPVLGLCYGHQWMAQALGGKVAPAKVKEYGRTSVRKSQIANRKSQIDLFQGFPEVWTVWMSHGDEVAELPAGFMRIASTKDCVNAAMMDSERRLYGIQWHNEVTHTEHGMEVLKRFAELCKPAQWSIKSYAEHVGAQIKKEVGDRKVFMLVSGGVDSTVAFTLLNNVLGADRVQGLLVDTGLMRKGEVQMIEEAFAKLGIDNLHIEDASEEFFRNLKDAYDPEEKRRIIGDTFLAVQKRVSEEMGLKMEEGWMLGQGTIYPDTIETGGTKYADKIKTHHNRVEAVQKMIEKGLVIEPLKELYKDEVRILGEELGLPHELVWRHPFPGPGLGVRILCMGSTEETRSKEISNVHIPMTNAFSVLPIRSVGVQGDGRTYRHAIAVFSDKPTRITEALLELATQVPNGNKEINRVLLCTSQSERVEFSVTPGVITRERAELLREADDIVLQEMRTADLYERIWQFPVVLLPVGIGRGEKGQSIVLRPIASTDAMTANAFLLPPEVIKNITERILRLPGIDAVFYDLTNKPPATIEWE